MLIPVRYLTLAAAVVLPGFRCSALPLPHAIGAVSTRGPDQSALDQQLATRLRLARDSFASGQTHRAAIVLRELLQEASSSGNIRAQAEVHLTLGEIALQRVLYGDALLEANEAMNQFRALGDGVGEAKIERLLGEIAYERGNSEEAKAYYRGVLTQFGTAALDGETARTLIDLAQASGDSGENAKELATRALALAQRSGDRVAECRARRRLAVITYYQGDNQASAREYEAAFIIARQIGNSVELTQLLIFKAIEEIDNGHAAEGLALCQSAVRLATESEDRYAQIDLLNQQGTALLVQRNFKIAAPLFEQSLEQAREYGVTLLTDAPQSNLANCLIEGHNFRGAVKILEESIREHPNAAQPEYRYFLLGQSYYELKEYDAASKNANRAFELASKAGNKSLTPYVLHLKAHIEDGLGQNDAADSDARAAMGAIEELRSQLEPSDFVKSGFSDATQDIYGEMIGLLVKSGRSQEALELSERARGRALLDLLATRGEQGKTTQVKAVTGPPNRSDGDSGLMATVSAHPLTAAEMTDVARGLSSTVVSYWVDSDATYIWVLTASGEIHATTVTIKADRLEALIRQLWPFSDETRKRGVGAAHREAKTVNVRTRGGESLKLNSPTTQEWRQLDRLLIEPVKRWLPAGSGQRLTIIGHGPLLLLPFASLKDYKGRYLLEQYTLSYAPSLSMLSLSHETAEEALIRPRQYLLVADPAPLPTGPDLPRLPALPAARREVDAIYHLLNGQKVMRLEGTEASVNRVVELSGNSVIIHLATHAITGEEQNFGSALVLAPTKWAQGRDGLLDAKAIYGLNLNSDLVFLSACRSGVGKISNDGVMGLTRAFLYAGAASVIVSLWDVADEPTSRLVIDFYRNWLNGEDKAGSLRQAQLHLLRDLRAGRVKIRSGTGDLVLPEDPVFWASFIVEGEP